MSPQTYFVSTNGSDEHDGTELYPWKTLQHAINQLQAGDTLYVREGEYNEALVIDARGDAYHGYITIQAYPGEKPIINGIGIASSRLVSFESAHYIIFDGFEIKEYFTDDANRSLNAIRIGSGSSNIYIQNNKIHHVEHRSEISANANIIKAYGDSLVPLKNINIINNTLHDLKLGSSEAITIVGNVDGFSVINNKIMNSNNIGIDIAGFYQTCPSGCDDQPRNGLVAGNDVSFVDTLTNPMYNKDQSAAGIYVDGARDTIIERNTVSNSNFGFSISSEKMNKEASGIIMRNNVMVNNHRAGLIVGGSSSSNGGATNILITNNTFILNNTISDGYGEITIQHHTIDNQFFNNIFYSSADTPYIHQARNTSYANEFDYNIFYSLGGTPSYWVFEDNPYSDFEQYRQASANDTNSYYIDPLFQNVEQLDLRLLEYSPAINSGYSEKLDSGKIDWLGNPRILAQQLDRGAVEFDAQATVDNKNEIKDYPLPPIAKVEKEASNRIAIDGILNDWKHLPSLATNDGNVREMRAVIQDETLYVAISGQLLKEKGQLYLYTDNPKHTTFNLSHWSTKHADFLIENGTLYQYSGGGTDWSWRKLKKLSNQQVVIQNKVIEYAIPLEDLGASQQEYIHFGYIWNDTKGDQLPNGGSMEKLRLSNPSVDESAASKPSNVSSDVIVIDGSLQDWAKIPLINQEQAADDLAVKVANDERYLYFMLDASANIHKEQIYINTDLDGNTGHQNSKWSTESGIDILIEEGILYQYSGSGKNWSFTKIEGLEHESYYHSGQVIEMKLELEKLNLKIGEQIKLGIMINDSKELLMPPHSTLYSYSIK